MVGDILEMPAGQLRICKYVGFERGALVYSGHAYSGHAYSGHASTGDGCTEQVPVPAWSGGAVIRETLMRAARLGDDIDDFLREVQARDESLGGLDPRQRAGQRFVAAPVTAIMISGTSNRRRRRWIRARRRCSSSTRERDRIARAGGRGKGNGSGSRCENGRSCGRSQAKGAKEIQSVMTLFVTGGAGFIGSEFIRQAIKKHRIVNFDKLTYAGNLDNLASVANNPGYSLVVGDVCDAKAVAAALPEDCDAVVHFAAESQCGPQHSQRGGILSSPMCLARR